MFTKSEIIEMIYRPANLDVKDMQMMIDSMLSWSDDKIINNLVKYTGAKVQKFGSMFNIC
jgi:nucleoid DNA-binding protein